MVGLSHHGDHPRCQAATDRPGGGSPGRTGRRVRGGLRRGGGLHRLPPSGQEGKLADRPRRLSGPDGRSSAATARAVPVEAVSWLLDADVLSQPAKTRGEPKVIDWLRQEQDRCYTSAVVIAQLAYW